MRWLDHDYQGETEVVLRNLDHLSAVAIAVYRLSVIQLRPNSHADSQHVLQPDETAELRWLLSETPSWRPD